MIGALFLVQQASSGRIGRVRGGINTSSSDNESALTAVVITAAILGSCLMLCLCLNLFSKYCCSSDDQNSRNGNSGENAERQSFVSRWCCFGSNNRNPQEGIALDKNVTRRPASSAGDEQQRLTEVNVPDGDALTGSMTSNIFSR